MTKHDYIQEMVKDFMAIEKENADSENFAFGYKISDQYVSDCGQPLYFELTDSSHEAKQVELPSSIMHQDITASSVEAHDMKLEWTTKQNPTRTLIVGYEIQVKHDGGTVVKTKKVGSEVRTSTIDGLEEDSEYQFGIVPLCEYGIRLPACEFSEPFKIKKEDSVQQSDVSVSLPEEQKSALPPSVAPAEIIRVEKKLREEKNGTRWFTVGEKADESLPEKVLLVVGGTGCGKSTLINALANYLNNVQFEDAFRYHVITEQDELEESGTSLAGRSKTKFVSAYEFGAARDLPYRLTVVDTPGFGDTEGVEKDRRTVGYIKEWFSQKKKKISAVCIVIKYNETRIKPQVQYELHSVISLFGKDVEMNVFMLFTFCDGSTPPTIAALKEMNLPVRNATFNINSSSVLTLPSERKEENEDDLFIAKHYWKMSMQSFEQFFNELKAVKDETLSVSLTVLRKREILDTLVRQIPIYVKRIGFLVDIIEQVKNKREEIDGGHRVKFQLDELIAVEEKKKDENQKSNNCHECKMTCHKDCGVLDPLTERNSCLMYADESSDLDNATGKKFNHCSQYSNSLLKSLNINMN
uniref:Fibronectin type-III domain-containing protein n=1 Tax=Plectus sambesii TaxID=2011161 RepID=A0A914W2Z8_9BILA